MGAQGTEEGLGLRLVLDAGALIAIERGDRKMIAMAEQARKVGATVIPASVLAQVWRGGVKAARLAKAIKASEIDVLNEDRAREVGQRLGARGGSDIADAHVVCCAIQGRTAIVTSDLDDTKALIEPGEEIELVLV
jgi:predicted nucleic acid-binding protein